LALSLLNRQEYKNDLMKKYKYPTTIIILLVTLTANAQLLDKLKDKVENQLETTTLSELSEEEVAAGLKEALNRGIEVGVNQLSKPGGYFKDLEIKIPMPDEAKQVETKLRQLGQGKLVDDAIESMNRAAEDAAIGAKELFVAAIKSMTLTDVMGILKGDDNAATAFLEKATRTALIAKFKPVIKKSLDKVGATKNWNLVFKNYNRLPMVKKINPDLEEYATDKAIDGLFIQIAKQELAIRQDPIARVSDLLKKVFGKG
jgi:hypothetical protein